MLSQMLCARKAEMDTRASIKSRVAVFFILQSYRPKQLL